MEKTPNPYSLKFHPDRPVLMDDSKGTGFHFHKGDKEYKRSPLARKILTIENITGVFIGKDFVTVSKSEHGSWNTIKPSVFSEIMEWYSQNLPAVEDEPEVTDTTILESDSEVVALIKELLETRIRPTVQDDGGDIFYKGFDEATGIVKVQLAGSCVGCPSSSVTLRNGVENMLMHYIAEVKGIENVDHEDDENDENFGRTLPLSHETTTEPSGAGGEDRSGGEAKKVDHPGVSI